MIFPCHWLTVLFQTIHLDSSLISHRPLPSIPMVDPGMTPVGLPHSLAEAAVESQVPLGVAQGTKLGSGLGHPDMAHFLLTRGL